MHAIYQLKDMLMSELVEIAEKGELTAGSLDTIHKLASSVKNLCKIIRMAEEDEDGESSYRRSSYEGGGSSYRRQGRDAMGRYTRDGGSSRDGGSAYYRSGRGSYYRAEEKEKLAKQIESLMNSTTNDTERKVLQKALESIEDA